VAEAMVSWGSRVTRAKLLLNTPGVVLLEGEIGAGANARAGIPVRIGLPGARNMVDGRLAAIGQNQRFLVALGSRAVRGAARVRVDLPCFAVGQALGGQKPVRIVDLSSSGARVQGLELEVGADFELRFVPPGHSTVESLRCVVVRTIGEDQPPDVGVAFCAGTLSFRTDLAQASPARTGT